MNEVSGGEGGGEAEIGDEKRRRVTGNTGLGGGIPGSLRISLVPCLSTPQVFITYSMKN